ncbi:hypothetical protein BDN72DRAFT_843332 [Pluteus cervinus]|uniref:Uncharacterized protein n=1 Tax=Pluteus cervinus TaxID=181527 RepID=A0ACD3ANL4_9AGAR|nr:hypothetical protein BDN72DRAFT_843332 [Pluteus cervinus]
MRVSFSQHYERVDAPPSTIWEDHEPGFEPNLNIQALHELFKLSKSETGANRADGNNEKGRKRVRGASPPSISKRVRVSPDSGASSAGVLDLTTADGSTIESPYPHLSYKYTVGGQSASILQHTFQVQYNLADAGEAPAQGDNADFYNWLSCGQAFLRALKHVSSPEEQRISLGRLAFAQYRGRLVATSTDLTNFTGTNDWLFLVPSLTDGIDLDEFGYSSPIVEDILIAAFLLQERYRVNLQGTLHLVLHPDISDNPNALPFHLEVDISVSLCLNYFFDSLFGRELKRKVTEFEDARRRLLDYAYTSHLPRPLSHEGATNIPFFYSILEPAPVIESKREETAQPPDLRAKLLPFQRRSVAWLLEREGKTLSADGSVVPLTSSTDYSFWEKIEEGNYVWYYNRLSGVLSQDAPVEPSPALGGILAEEPGLGKTMETIALILMNPAPPERNPSVTRWDPATELNVRAIKTTLIVTPPSLASQWVDELATHAPTLKVLVYDGWTKLEVPATQYQVELERKRRLESAQSKSKTKSQTKTKTGSRTSSSRSKKASTSKGPQVSESDEDSDDIIDWCTYVQKFDIVITTYSVLRNDLNVARAPFIRTRRHETAERFRSPLVMCEWNRVVMDEVQMVGGGKAEDMVALIPRLSSFAVSGTPARTQTSDLMHVLRFLRIDHVLGSNALWDRLRKPGYAGEFAAFFQKYAIRTMKSTVNTELTIPQQTRFLVPIDLGRVERHVYAQNLEAGLLTLGLDARGVASRPDWEVDSVLLRQIIRKLRGICTHPQVGQLPAYKLGSKSSALKSMAEVLRNMSDQNWRNVVDDWKAMVTSLIRKAQLQQRNTKDLRRYHSALETLYTAEKEVMELIQDIESVIAVHKEQGDILIKEAKANREKLESSLPANHSDPKGKGKAREVDAEDESDAEEAIGDVEDKPPGPTAEDLELPRTPAGKEHAAKRGALTQRLRECKVVLHRIKFLQGDVYHVLGDRHVQSEEEAYATAEELRKELLSGAEHDAHRAVDAMIEYANDESLSLSMLRIEEPYLKHYGIRSSELATELNDIIEVVLNAQSELLWEWRENLTSLLTQKLSPGEDEADGQEYQRTLDNQGNAEVYIKAYSALLADMREALMHERTLLAAHDVREKHVRKTHAAMRAAAEFLDTEDVDLQPEHDILHQELTEKRKELLEDLGGRAVKSILNDLGDALARITKDTDPEKDILKDAVARVRSLINDHNATLNKFESDLTHLRRIFNQRILYFRQLQEISDSVAEIVLEGSVENALGFCYDEQQDLASKIKTNRARQRYLENLNKDKGKDALDADDETCILCRCEFVRGFITQCAHVFCEDCMKAWFQRKEGKTCPVCRVGINPDAVQRFTVDDSRAPAEIVNGEVMPKSRRHIDYNKIDPELLKTIQQVESFGDYGSKIQTIVRHILHLKFTDPGTKSIVFSAWADSLHIVEAALHDNGVACLRIDQKSKGEVAAKRFKNDPDIHVLLLHGERENAGLNITCASRVFLMESVVHHGFELQAIARIDRMGQTRQTEVFCYYAEDTIEKNILDLAARQGLSLYTKDKSAGTLHVTSFAHDEDKKKITDSRSKKKVQKGDFILKTDDMLAILFPHLYEDLEYLIPQDGLDGMEQDNTESEVNRRSFQNAEAGPSRRRL